MDALKKLNRGIGLESKKEKEYKLPAYLPSIDDYVFCTIDNTWRHKDAICEYTVLQGGLYLENKRLVVDQHIYMLENNLEEEGMVEKGEIKDLSIFLTLIDILPLLFAYIVGNSTAMFYRMCLVSKRIKRLTVEYTDYVLMMSVCNIGRMRLQNVNLEEIDKRVLTGIVMSGNFALKEICYDVIAELIIEVLKTSDENTPLYKTVKEQIKYLRITTKSSIELRTIKQMMSPPKP